MAATVGSDLSLREVNDRFDEVCGHLNALHGELLDLTVWLLSHESWKSEGLWTPGQYLAWRAGVSPATAKKLITVADRPHLVVAGQRHGLADVAVLQVVHL